jgi:predicted lipoprotein with Yx(FWY)xxD motif
MQKTVDKGSACCLTTTFRSCEHELERSRRKMTNKKFKLAAMSLATAVAVSAVGPSASAVTYQLEKGDVTVGQDGTGAYSYQNQTDGKTDNVYVDQDTQNNGQIIITQAEGTKTDNTVTVEEDVTNEKGKRDVDIILDGVNVDTSDTSTSTDTPTEVPADTKEDKTIIKVGEGADVDLTVRESNLTTGGNGIDIGVNLKDGDDNKETNVDLTLDNTKINLTENATAGINARDNSDVDITLKGDNTIDGSEAIDKVTEGGGHDISKDNVNVEGIRVGGEGASDSSDANEGAKTHLTISGGVEKTETAEADTEETESPAGGSLTISKTTGGLVMADGSDVEITDGADVTIEDTKTSSSTQAGRAVTQHGDLTLSGGSSLTIDGGKDNKVPHTGIGIASWDDITVEDGSTLDISGAATGIYGHQGSDASLTVKDSTLNISDVKKAIEYEGAGVDKEGKALKSAGDITFEKAKVNIDAGNIGIMTGNNGTSSIKLDDTEAKITVGAGGTAIYGPEKGGKGDLNIAHSKLDIDASAFYGYGIRAGYKNVNIRDGSVVNSISSAAGIILTGSEGNATKLNVSNSLYNLTTAFHYGVWACVADGAYQGKPTHTILVNDNGAMNISDTAGSPYVASAGIMMDDGVSLIADNGVITTNGKYQYGGINAYGNDINIRFKDNSHVDVESITYDAEHKNQNLIVTGGTLTYDYSADNTLWPVNEQGDKLTNFLLTKDDARANFDALSYKGQTYTYLSDLNKETGKQYLSVWVPAAALNYMLDVDGSHDPEIIGKVLEELKQAGYKFDTAYQTAENGDQVVILRDMVVNGKSLNFTKTTDAEGNTKLIWGNYEKQADGAPSAYDMVYGTEYEYEGKTYTIVWGYESQNNPNTTAAAGVLDAFGPDSNVKVTGENIDGTDSAQYTVTIYGALREVTDPVIPTNPAPETPEDSDPTPPAPTTPTTPAVQDARPTTSTVEQAVAKTTPAPETPVNPPVQDARPESGKLIQTGTTNWMADVLVRAGGVLLAAGYLLERKRKGMFHKAQH